MNNISPRPRTVGHVAHPLAPDAGSTTLTEILGALGNAVAELRYGPDIDPLLISTVALVESADLSIESNPLTSMQDLYLLVGVAETDALTWLDHLRERPPAQRPRAVMSKIAHDSQPLYRAAREHGVALIAVNPQARWDLVFAMVERVLRRGMQRQQTAPADSDLVATDTDLFGLAQIIAQNTGGMVSIEDARSHVLAYSASDEAADELRTLSILGRQGPSEYLRVLRDWGVFDRLRDSDDVIDVPAHPELGTKRRMVVGIRLAVEGYTGVPRLLGSIWVQQGASPLRPDADDVLRGGSAIAARIISRTLDAPSAEGLLIQRLLGVRGDGVDVPSVAGALNIPTEGPAAVIGLTVGDADPATVDLGDIGSMLRLYASSFRRDSVVTVIADRAYVLLPRFPSVNAVTGWTRHVIGQFENSRSLVLRAAIAAPIGDLDQVAAARAEVDRVLDGTASDPGGERVTTLAESRTAVLLGEIVGLLADRPELHDPRLDALVDYDTQHSSGLRESAEVYLAQHGDVRGAAAFLNVHPNTLRYRLRRIEEIVGLDLADPSDRLLFEMQLALRRRIELPDITRSTTLES